jgi:predicted RNA-binding Zn ribbon-like protein
VKPIRELPFVAGHVALDFVNTAEGREGPVTGEALLAAADLRAWGQRYDLLGRSAGSPDAAAELERAKEARELLYGVFDAKVRDGIPSERDLKRLSELAAEAHAAGQLRADGEGRARWRWSRSELASVRHAVVSSAVELLQVGPAPRFRECPGDHCGWLFLDTTKRGNRRWCQMRECGQEAKDKRRRQRAIER